MSTYAIYRETDGVVVKHVTCPLNQLDRNIPQGCAAYEGTVDELSQRIDPETHSVVDWQPPKPDDEHEWDDASRRWRKLAEVDRYEVEQARAREAIAAIEAGQVRTFREALLGDEAAIERLREKEPEIAAARAVLRRPRPQAPSSVPAPSATPEPLAE